MDLTRRFCSPSFSAPMAAPFSIKLAMGILQVTDLSLLVAYLFWIPVVANFKSAEDFYQDQEFKTTAIPTLRLYW